MVAGSYPALYLSSFQPAAVLKGKGNAGNAGSIFRRSLVVFQFVVAIALVCGTIIVAQQLEFMRTKDLGFDASQKIILPLRNETVRQNHTALANEFGKVSGITNITATDYVPASNIWTDFTLYREGSSMDYGLMVKNNWIEPNYLDFLNIKILTGRNFRDDRISESQNKIIVNQKAAELLGFRPDEIVGQTLYNDRQSGRRSFEVIGVMDNYHQVSVKEEIFPVLFRVPEEATEHDHMLIDVEAGSLAETIEQVENIWRRINPDTPFEYSFLDEEFGSLYDEDKRVSQVVTGFTVIAMIISCLGLYGLSTYMAERRYKEIGVRKVLGASVRQIMMMMSSEFVKLVLFSFTLAVPLSIYAINRWLENFAYKTPVSISIFLAAGAIALLIAILTVSVQSFRAASNNPAESLRTE
jgi:putative ABC transport system permease protein